LRLSACLHLKTKNQKPKQQTEVGGVTQRQIQIRQSLNIWTLPYGCECVRVYEQFIQGDI